jgi:hypothetical protein
MQFLAKAIVLAAFLNQSTVLRQMPAFYQAISRFDSGKAVGVLPSLTNIDAKWPSYCC